LHPTTISLRPRPDLNRRIAVLSRYARSRAAGQTNAFLPA